MSRDECFLLNNHIFGSKACIAGAAKGTTDALIDESKQMVGQYEVLIKRDCKDYMINLKVRIEEHTPTRRQFLDFTKTFAFICEQCGIRGCTAQYDTHLSIYGWTT